MSKCSFLLANMFIILGSLRIFLAKTCLLIGYRKGVINVIMGIYSAPQVVWGPPQVPVVMARTRCSRDDIFCDLMNSPPAQTAQCPVNGGLITDYQITTVHHGSIF